MQGRLASRYGHGPAVGLESLVLRLSLYPDVLRPLRDERSEGMGDAMPPCRSVGVRGGLSNRPTLRSKGVPVCARARSTIAPNPGTAQPTQMAFPRTVASIATELMHQLNQPAQLLRSSFCSDWHPWSCSS